MDKFNNNFSIPSANETPEFNYFYPNYYYSNFSQFYPVPTPNSTGHYVDPSRYAKLEEKNTSTSVQSSPQNPIKMPIVAYPTPPSDQSLYSADTSISNSPESNKSAQDSSLSESLSRDQSTSKISKSKRRTRTQFSKQQIDCLEAVFNKSHYPEVQMVDRLSEKLGLSIERISVWFQNRRAKFKKTKKSSDNQLSPSSSTSFNLIGNTNLMQNFNDDSYLNTNSNSTSSYQQTSNTTNCNSIPLM
jgi:hypothetical protein